MTDTIEQTGLEKAEHLAAVKRRWDALPERLNEKTQLIKGPDLGQVNRLLTQACNSSSRTKALVWLRKAADVAAQPFMDHSACRTGCSHCCHLSVSVTDAEANQIAKETGRSLAPVAGWRHAPDGPDITEHRVAEGAKWGGVPCTFLKDDRCSIYEIRPLSCRLQINLDDDGFLCILVPGEDWVIYDKPLDFPESFVARKWENGSPTVDVREAPSLDALCAKLPGLNEIALPHEDKDQRIVKVLACFRTNR